MLPGSTSRTGTTRTTASLREWVRQTAEDSGRNVALLQDIQGPKIRVGSFSGGSIELDTDDVFRIAPGRMLSTEPDLIYVDYSHLLEDVEEGEEIILADGLIRLIVIGRNGDHLQARVLIGGMLGDGKGVAFPHTDLRVPTITEKDERDLAFGREVGVDWIAASFVRSGDDLKRVRELAGDVPVIAKIELAAAYANLDDILQEAAGVMVARGDLGVQLPLETIPLVQANILRRTNEAGVVSITATEMLESMTHSPRPTRAEVTDVANAVLAGTDAVMLSAETAVGLYPVESVSTMARICASVESETSTTTVKHTYLTHISAVASAVAQAAVDAAANLGIQTIVAFTESGSTARLLSKYRPAARIVAFTPVDHHPKGDVALSRGHRVPLRAPGLHRSHDRGRGEVSGKGRSVRSRGNRRDGCGDPSESPGFHQPVEGPCHRRAGPRRAVADGTAADVPGRKGGSWKRKARLWQPWVRPSRFWTPTSSATS